LAAIKTKREGCRQVLLKFFGDYSSFQGIIGELMMNIAASHP